MPTASDVYKQFLNSQQPVEPAPIQQDNQPTDMPKTIIDPNTHHRVLDPSSINQEEALGSTISNLSMGLTEIKPVPDYVLNPTTQNVSDTAKHVVLSGLAQGKSISDISKAPIMGMLKTEGDLSIAQKPWSDLTPEERQQIWTEDVVGQANFQKSSIAAQFISNTSPGKAASAISSGVINLLSGKDRAPTFWEIAQTVSKYGLDAPDNKKQAFLQNATKFIGDLPAYLTSYSATGGWGTFTGKNLVDQAMDKINRDTPFDSTTVKTAILTDALFKAMPALGLEFKTAGGVESRLAATSGNAMVQGAAFTGIGAIDQWAHNMNVNAEDIKSAFVMNTLLMHVISAPKFIQQARTGKLQQDAVKWGLTEDAANTFSEAMAKGNVKKAADSILYLFEGDQDKIDRFLYEIDGRYGKVVNPPIEKEVFDKVKPKGDTAEESPKAETATKAQLTPENADDVVATYSQNMDELADTARPKSDAALLGILGKQELGPLFNIARAFNPNVKSTDRQELIDTIMENRFRLPEYNALLEKNIVTAVEKKDDTVENKHYYKWMTTGEIHPNQIPMIKTALQHMIPGGDVEQFFADNMEIQGNKGFIDFNRLGEWFVFGPNAFDIEAADKIIAAGETKQIQLSPEQVKGLVLPSVKIDSEARANADYTKPVILGTVPNGMMLIDGHHRVAAAVRDGVGVVANVLNADQTRGVAHPESEMFAPRFDQESIDKQFGIPPVFDPKDGLGAVPDNQDVDYKGFRVAMTPDQFNKLVPSGVSNPKSQTALVEKLKVGEKLGPPTIWVNWDSTEGIWKVKDHEGRSRALAFADEYGQANMDVHVIANVRARDITREMKDAPIVPQDMGAGLYNDPVLSKYYKQSFKERGAQFFQKGKTFPSGAHVKRGSLTLLRNGKFLLDLFKGGDLGTLSHEFAHLFSQIMPENGVDTIVSETMRLYYPQLTGRQAAGKKSALKQLWNRYRADPHAVASTVTGASKQNLTTMQEFVATSFEAYLSQGRAPNRALQPYVSEAARLITDYYKKVRQLPLEFQSVNDKMAEMFDGWLTQNDRGQAIPRDVTAVEVKLKDEATGKVHKYFVNKSKAQIAKHKAILSGLSHWLAKESGLKDMLAEYTESMLNPAAHEKRMKLEESERGTPKMDIAHRNAVSLISNEKQARKYLDSVDVEAAKKQEARLEKKVKKIQKLAKNLQASDMPDDIKQVFGSVLDAIDLKKRTERNKQQMIALAHAIGKLRNAYEIELEDVPQELLNTTPAMVKDLTNFKKRQLEYFSEQELDNLYETLRDIYKYNKHRMKQAREEVRKEYEQKRDTAVSELDTNWRVKKGLEKQKEINARKKHGIVKMLQSYKAEVKSSLINIYALGNWNSDSIFVQAADGLVEGRVTEKATTKEWYNVLRHMAASIPTHGVSTTLGSVAPNDMVPIQLYRVKRIKGKTSTYVKQPVLVGETGYLMEKPEQINVTLGQLMYWYGQSQNESGMKALRSGVIFPDQKEEMFHFGNDEAILTAISKLPDEYKKFVDFLMMFYARRVYPAINDVFKDLNYGISLPFVEKYLPLAVRAADKQNILKETQGFVASLNSFNSSPKDFYQQHIQSLDFLHHRIEHGQPLYAMDIFDIVGRNINNVAFYVGMAKPITNFQSLVFGEKDIPGSVHWGMVKAYGRVQTDTIEKWIRTVEDPGYRTEKPVINWLIGVNSKVRTAFLNFAPTVMLLQPITARLVLGFGVTEATFQEAWAHTMLHLFDGNRMKELMDYDPLNWDRYERIPQVHMDREGVDHRSRRAWIRPRDFMQDLFKIKSKQDLMDLLARSPEHTLMMLPFMDSIAIYCIKKCMEIQFVRKEGLGDAIALKKFRECVTTSQPMNDPLFTSNWMGNKNAAWQMTWGVFRAARDGLIRVDQRDLMALDNNVHKQAGGRPYKDIMRSRLLGRLSVMLLTGLVMTAMRRLTRDEDKHKNLPDENFWKDFGWTMAANESSNYAFFGDLLSGYINTKVHGWESNVGEAPLLSAVATQGQAIDKIWKDYGNKDNWDYEGDLPKDVVDLIATLTIYNGSAWYNIDRNLTKWIKKYNEE